MKGNRVDIMGIKVDDISSTELLEVIDSAARTGERRVIAYTTIHAMNLAHRLPWFRTFLNSCNFVYADGEGVRLAAKLLGKQLPPTIALTRWIWNLCEYCEARGLSVYLLGSEVDVVHQAYVNLRDRYPRLKLLGYHHGYFDKTGPESDAVVDEINKLSPNVLIVGFEMPMQEEWIHRNKEKLHANSILTGGACLEYAAGARRAAPRWISRIGFEWFIRFLKEPRRLFVRYFIGNPEFIIRVLRYRFRSAKNLATHVNVDS